MATSQPRNRSSAGGGVGLTSDRPPHVSILLVSWNTCDETRRCLASLCEAVTDDVRYEVIAVDNGSRDGSGQMLASWPGVQLLRNDTNVGYAAAINQAYRRAGGELILLLNSDIRCQPGALSQLVAFLRQRPDAAGVAPLYRNTAIPHHYRDLTLTGAIALHGRMRQVPVFRTAFRNFTMAGEDFSRARPVPMPMAACLLLRRSVLGPETIFDERLPLYFNDVHLEHRLASRGLTLWMTPQSVVEHSVGASGRLLPPKTQRRHFTGGLSGYVHLSQPAHRVRIFQAVLMAYWLVGQLAGRHGRDHLDLREMLACLRGDPGPLPDTALQPAPHSAT
jgi:GT2 family glycosyltransferase